MPKFSMLDQIKPWLNAHLDELSRNSRKEIQEAGQFSDEQMTDFDKLLLEASKSVKKTTKPRVNVDRKGFQGIMEDGKFKTQFETGRSGGRLDPEYRKDAEKELFGDPKELENLRRTIYGTANSKSAHNAKQYGSNVFETKPYVNKRTTWSLSDSFKRNVGRPGFADWQLLTSPKIQGEFNIVNLPEYLKDSYDVYDNAEDALQRNKDRVETLIEYIGANDGTGGVYNEVQIHGGLPLSDISKVTMGELEAKNPVIRQRAIDAAREFGFQLDEVAPTRTGKRCIANCPDGSGIKGR